MIRHHKYLYVVLGILLMSSISVNVASEIPLSGLLLPDSENNLDRSSSISFSSDGNILATVYQREIYLYHPVTRAELEISPIVLNDDIKSVEFSEDSTNQGQGYLLVGRDSILTNSPAVSVISSPMPYVSDQTTPKLSNTDFVISNI